MAKFDRIISLNNKYTKELNEALRIASPGLIQAFTNIFGQKHHDYIAYTINYLETMFSISKSYTESIIAFNKYASNHILYLNKYYLKYYKYLNYLAKKLPEEKQFAFFFVLRKPPDSLGVL